MGPEALAALRGSDPIIGALIDKLGDLDRRAAGRPPDAYGALVRSIVGQQLSTAAARTIHGRLLAIFDGHTPSPAELLAADSDAVRAAGLSRPKIAYLRDLAARVIAGELDLERLGERSDEEVSTQLTAVKGLGQWTADMFLIFHLGRPDVLPAGDLGIRRAVARAYSLDQLPAPERLREIAERWRPQRSLASLYLWRSLDARG